MAYRQNRQNQNETPNTPQYAGKPQYDYPSKAEKNPTDLMELRDFRGAAHNTPFNLQRGQYQNETKELQERQQAKPPINETHVKRQSDYPSKSGTKEQKHQTDVMENREVKRVLSTNPFQRRQNPNMTKEIQEKQQVKPPINETLVKPQSVGLGKRGSKECKQPTDFWEFRNAKGLVRGNPYGFQRGQNQNETKELQEKQQVKPPLNETHVKPQSDTPSKSAKEQKPPTDVMENQDVKRVVSNNPFRRGQNQNKAKEDSPFKSGTKDDKHPTDLMENPDAKGLAHFHPFHLQRGQVQKETKELQEKQQVKPPINETHVKSDGPWMQVTKEYKQPTDFMEFRKAKGFLHYNPYDLQRGQNQNETKELQERQQAKPPHNVKSQPDAPPQLASKGIKEVEEQKNAKVSLKPMPDKSQSDSSPQSKGMKVDEQKKAEVPIKAMPEKSPTDLPPQSASKVIKQVDVQKKAKVSLKPVPDKSQSDSSPQSKGMKVDEQKKAEVPIKAMPEKSPTDLPPQSASKGIKEVDEQKKAKGSLKVTLEKSDLPPQLASKGTKEVDDQKARGSHKAAPRKSQSAIPSQSTPKGMKEENEQKKAELPPPRKSQSARHQSASKVSLKATADKPQPDLPPQSTSKGMNEQKKAEVPPRKSQSDRHQSASKETKEVDDQKKVSLKATPNKPQSELTPQSASKREVDEQKKVDVPPRKSKFDLPQSASKGTKEVDEQKKLSLKATPNKAQSESPPQSASKGTKEVDEQKKAKVSLKPTPGKSNSDSPAAVKANNLPKQKPKLSPPKQKAPSRSSQLPTSNLPPQQSPSGNLPSRRLNQPASSKGYKSQRSTAVRVNGKKFVGKTKQSVSGTAVRPKTQRKLKPAGNTLSPRRPLHWPKIDYSQLQQQPVKKRRVLRRVYVGRNNWESGHLQQQLQLETAASQNPYNVCIREQYHQCLSNSYCEGS